MIVEAAPTGPLPDPLETLTKELLLRIEEMLARGSGEYDQGFVAGLFLAIDPVEREQTRLREIYEEHVPGRVYGPRADA